MRTTRLFRLVTSVIMLLTLPIVLETVVYITGYSKGDCRQDRTSLELRKNFVAASIKAFSNKQFELFDGDGTDFDFEKDIYKILPNSDSKHNKSNETKDIKLPYTRTPSTTGAIQNYVFSVKRVNIRANNFIAYLFNGNHPTITAYSRTYQGTFVNGRIPVVALYAPSAKINEEKNETPSQGYMSGFIKVSPSESYFFESVRPLLLRSGKTANELNNNNLRESCKTLIVYRTQAMNFRIVLGGRGEPTAQVPSMITQQRTTPINIAVVGDLAYNGLITSSVGDYPQTGAQLEELIFFTNEQLRPYIAGGQNPVVIFEGQLFLLPNWDGPPNANAWNMLCDFLTNDRTSSARSIVQSADLALILTGKSLAPISKRRTNGQLNRFNDSGAFCPADSCNGTLGLAAGIGGIGAQPTCDTNSESRNLFTNPGKYSIAQMQPWSSSLTTYGGTVYERQLLVNHEIGHNLNAVHPAGQNAQRMKHDIICVGSSECRFVDPIYLDADGLPHYGDYPPNGHSIMWPILTRATQGNFDPDQTMKRGAGPYNLERILNCYRRMDWPCAR
jgi:hypothetical protein